jgi:hypothetical protein
MSTKNTFLQFFTNFSLSVVAGSMLGFIFTGYIVTAQFQPPTKDPPEGNVAPPINTSNTGQIKGGGLALNNNNVVPDALVVVNGYIQVGTRLGDPLPGDCTVALRGRMIVDPNPPANGRLWVCSKDGIWRSLSL